MYVRGIDLASFYDCSIQAVMYSICVLGGIDLASISMILELLRQLFIVCFFHLISITSTWIMKDIGGQVYNAVAVCPEANKDLFKLVNIKN